MHKYEQYSNNLESLLGVTEMKQWEVVATQVLAEFLGTLLFIGLASIAGTGTPNLVAEGFANGIFLASMIHMFGHVSGGHFNPAVTIGMLIYGDIKLIKSILYIGSQALGSIAGSYIAYWSVPKSTRGNLGATIPHDDLSVGQIIGLEILMTFVLVSVILICKRRDAFLTALTVGLSLTACLFSSGFYTGSLNPVRTLGPAVVMDLWKYHWVYWVGPICGGILAGLFHRLLFSIYLRSKRIGRRIGSNVSVNNQM